MTPLKNLRRVQLEDHVAAKRKRPRAQDTPEASWCQRIFAAQKVPAAAERLQKRVLRNTRGFQSDRVVAFRREHTTLRRALEVTLLD